MDALGNPLDIDDDDTSDYDVLGLGGTTISRSRSSRRHHQSGRLGVPNSSTGGGCGCGTGGASAGFRSSIVTVESLVSNSGHHQVVETDIGLWKSDSMSKHDSES